LRFKDRIDLSPPSQRIIDWIHDKGFSNREEVEDYVHHHGGASLTMDASIDFVFGAREPVVETPKATGKTPLEQIQAGEVPTQPSVETTPTEQGTVPEEVKQSVQAPIQQEVKKSLFRRFIDWLGS
jgi:hypothetical protein